MGGKKGTSERSVYIFPSKSYIVRHLHLWFILSLFSLWYAIGLLWFIYNCLNIIPWKTSTPTTVLSWHPHQKSVTMGCGRSLVAECVDYPQSPAFSLQRPKGRQTMTRGRADCFRVLASIWLITFMPVSCCFSQFCFAVSFGNHKHEFSSFVLSQILSAILTWDFLTVLSVREHDAAFWWQFCWICRAI